MIRGLSFMPGTYVGPGYSRLGYSSGSRAVGFGDIQGDAATVVALGIADQGTMDTLLFEGATDQDVIDLLNGVTDVPTLMNKLTMQPFAQQSGITMQYEPTDWASYGVESALDSLDSDISQLETWSRESTAVRNDIGPQIQAARAQFNSWHATYQNWVNQSNAPVLITLPDGTKELAAPALQAGVNPTVIVVAATVLALAGTIDYYHEQTIQGLIARAKADMAATGMQQIAIQQAAAAAAAGHPGVASDIAKIGQTAGTTPPGQRQPASWTLWLQQNTGVVIGALALIFVAPPLLASFGARKR